MEPEERTDWIDKYLTHQLKGEQLAFFEEKLRTDPSLGREVALQARLIASLREIGLQQFLLKVEKEFKPPKPKPGPESYEFSMKNVRAMIDFDLRREGAIEQVRSPRPPSPSLVYINFEGEDFYGQPCITTAEGKLIKVQIYPPTNEFAFHYRVRPVLTLYGVFDPDKLTLIAGQQDKRKFYVLRIGEDEYELEAYSVPRPLIKKK